jgi:hypothetical protein
MGVGGGARGGRGGEKGESEGAHESVGAKQESGPQGAFAFYWAAIGRGRKPDAFNAFYIDWDPGPPPAENPSIEATEVYQGQAQDAGTNTYTQTPRDKTACLGDPSRTYRIGDRGHLTDTHVTYTYVQGTRNVAWQHVHPLTPAPNHTQIILPSPINIPGLQSVQSLQYRSPST